MSNADGNGASAPSGNTAKPGFWQRLKNAIIRTDTELSFLKGLGIVSVLGTLIAGYFQYLSAYHDKVSALAQEDMTAATSAFSEASNALSIPLSLQERLIFGYAAAAEETVDADDNAYVTKSARAISQNYEDAYTALRENVNLVARKMEIYLDWPSDMQRDPANPGAPNADPINLSLLGTYNFDCDKDDDMPFEKDRATLPLKHPDGKSRDLTVDWNSAKHHVFTIVYCFDFTHKRMKTVRQWASKSPVDRAQREEFLKELSTVKKRLDNQVVRLNIFMGVAMNEIDRIRVKYEPNGFKCHVPILREAIDLFPGHECTPVLTRE
jgi:hypothetical protein